MARIFPQQLHLERQLHESLKLYKTWDLKTLYIVFLSWCDMNKKRMRYPQIPVMNIYFLVMDVKKVYEKH